MANCTSPCEIFITCVDCEPSLYYYSNIKIALHWDVYEHVTTQVPWVLLKESAYFCFCVFLACALIWTHLRGSVSCYFLMRLRMCVHMHACFFFFMCSDGFRKVMHIDTGIVKQERDGPVEFQHPYFKHGQDDLLENIKRKVESSPRCLSFQSAEFLLWICCQRPCDSSIGS